MVEAFMSDCLRHAPTLLSRSFDDEFVVIDLETGTYYSLTGAAATAWELLGAGIDRAGLAEGLARVFDAEPMTVESDLDRFLDWCRSEALVVPAETPGAAIA